MEQTDERPVRHYAGCDWLCGSHRSTWQDYGCCCLTPKPARGQRDHCLTCDAKIPAGDQ